MNDSLRRLRSALSELRTVVGANAPHSPLAWCYRAIDEIAPLAQAAGCDTAPMTLKLRTDLEHAGALPDDPGDLAGVILLRTPRGDDAGEWELQKGSPTPGLQAALLGCATAWLAWIDAQDVPTAVLSPPALSERAQEVLLALQREEAVTSDGRVATEVVANAVGGPNANRHQFTRAMKELKAIGLVDAKVGRGGGVWLTVAGARRAAKL